MTTSIHLLNEVTNDYINTYCTVLTVLNVHADICINAFTQLRCSANYFYVYCKCSFTCILTITHMYTHIQILILTVSYIYL